MTTVFILDDDADLLLAMNTWLSKQGYKVYTFTDSAALLHAVNKLKPDFILLDVLMGEQQHGTSICKELKQQYHFPNKIYLFSATHLHYEEVMKCDADGFIDKPFDLPGLLDTLNKAVLKSKQ